MAVIEIDDDSVDDFLIEVNSRKAKWEAEKVISSQHFDDLQKKRDNIDYEMNLTRDRLREINSELRKVEIALDNPKKD